MELDYDLIGKFPEVELCKDTLHHSIKFWREARGGALKKRFQLVLEKCAQHFYGLVVDQFADTEALIDGMLSMDEELKFQ